MSPVIPGRMRMETAMNTTNDGAHRKERTMSEQSKRQSQGEWIVETHYTFDEATAWVCAVDCQTKQEAEKWIRTSGQGGEVYRIAKVWPTVKVFVESMPYRVVGPA